MGPVLFLFAILRLITCQQILILTLGSGEDRYLAYQSARILSSSGVNVTLIAGGDVGPRSPGLEIVIIPTKASEKEVTQEFSDLKDAHLAQTSAIAAENLEMCRVLYRDNFAQKILEKANYDVAIVTLAFSDSCILPLMKVMQLPVIGLATSQIDLPWVYYNADVPYPLSYIPVLIDGNPDHYSTVDKLRNFRRWWSYLSTVDAAWKNPALGIASRSLEQNFDLKQLYNDIGLIMTSSDLLIDYPIPLPPHIVHAGCFYCLPPLDFEGISKEFADNAKNGIVFIATDNPLDDSRTAFPQELTNVWIDAVVNAGYSAIVTTDDPKLREHRPRPSVLYLRNPPRTDILGHSKTRAFISRCSFTEMFESLYYGVPIICLPTTAAQKLAATRAVELGAAEKLQWNSLKQPDGLQVAQEMVSLVIKDKKYREALRHISQDVRDRPLNPLDVFVYWVNYAIRHHGHTHLRSEVAKTLSVSSYYFIDVILLVTFSFVGLLGIFVVLTIFVARSYFDKTKNVQKKHV